MEVNDSFTVEFSSLCDKFVDKKKAHLGQPKLTRENTKKSLKRTLYNALFTKLRGPHSGSIFEVTDNKNIHTDVYGVVLQLRSSKRLDDAKKLDDLTDLFFKEHGDQELKQNVMKFLLNLAQVEQKPLFETLGQNVFKPPVLNSKNFEILPTGPRHYGDSTLPRSENDHYFMHFPSTVFMSTGINDKAQNKEENLLLENDIFSQIPGTGLPFIFSEVVGKTEYEKENQSSLFGALIKSRSSLLDMKLDIPELSENVHYNGFHIPKCFDIAGDEGYESTLSSTPSSDVTLDSGRGSVTSANLWERALVEHTQKFLAWEFVGKAVFTKENPYLTDAGASAFDRLYKVHMDNLNLLDPTLKLPVLCAVTMKKLVNDTIYMLIGVPSTSFEYDSINEIFIIREGLSVSGLSYESVSQLCKSLLNCGTHYIRLENFAQPANMETFQFKGLVFHAFTEGLRKYLQHYRGCILSISHDRSILELTYLLNNVVAQINFMAELCGCSVSGRSLPDVLKDGKFPTGIGLLSYLYEESLDVSNSHHYPMLLSLLHSASRPYLLFLQDWVFQGIHRDRYGEFMINVNENFLESRDVSYWTHGFYMPGIEEDVSVPVFLKDLNNEIFVCGKSINLLRVIAPQHFLLQVDKELPRIRITFSEQDLSSIETKCRVYRSKMQEITYQLTISREQMIALEAKAKHELLVTARKTATLEMKQIQERSRALRLEEDLKKRKLFSELRSQMEAEMKQRKDSVAEERREDAQRVNVVNKQEIVEARASEELERQTREEMIEYYAKLTEEATKREQRALWHIRRRQLQSAREAFFQKQLFQEEMLLLDKPLPDGHGAIVNLAIGSELSETDTLHVNEKRVTLATNKVSENTLPKWAQEGIQSDVTKEVCDTAEIDNVQQMESALLSENNLPSWVNRTETVILEEKDLKQHPSQSSIQSVLYQADNSVGSKKGPFLVYATDKQHPSDNSVKGLLKIETESKEKTAVAKNKLEYVTVDDLKEAEILHALHTGNIPLKEVNHPSSSVIQELMYDPDVATEQILQISSDVTNLVAKEENEQTCLEKNGREHDEITSCHIPAKTHVKIIDNKHATTESTSEIVFKPSVKLVEHVPSLETQEKQNLPHIKLVEGVHISKESDQTLVSKTHIKKVQSHSCTGESEPELSTKKALKSVEGKHISEESKQTDETFKSGVRYFPNIHCGKETLQKENVIKQPNVFGHVSEVCRQEYAILAPKLKKVEQKHASKESDWFSYQVKSYRKKVAGHSVNETSEPADIKAIIKKSDSAHISKESEHIDVDQNRLNKFKELNVFGHSSDSSAQKLLYGDVYGRIKKSDGRNGNELPSFSAGDINFFTDTHVVPYEDHFDMLSYAPQVDLLKGHYITDIDGGLCLPSEINADTSAHAFVSLSTLLKRSITAPLTAQIAIVNQNILNLFNAEFQVQKHFDVLRCFMLMQDGEFGQSLTDQLFEKLSNSPTVNEFFNPVFLNSVLQRALQSSLQGDHAFAGNLSFMVKQLPPVLKHNALDALDGLEMTYEVDWPVNIVITNDCLAIYSKVFSFMVLLKRTVWSLKDIFYKMKRDAVVTRASNSQQYKLLQLYRHEMQYFVKVIQGYIANQVIHVSWQEFKDQLQNHVFDLDDLHDSHMSYLINCQSRCLLNKKAANVMQIIESIFALILKFRMQLINDDWIRGETGGFQHPRFEQMCTTFKSFTQYSRFLFKVVNKLAIRGYQPHLKELVLRLNFNEYYSSTQATQ